MHMYLVIILSADLKWKNHIDHVISLAKRKIGLLKRRSFALSRKQKCSIYLNIIRPAMEYASLVYYNCSTHDSIRLEQVQRRASTTYNALVCACALKQTDTKRLLDVLGWYSLSVRRTAAGLCYMFKLTRNFLLLTSPILPRLSRNADTAYGPQPVLYCRRTACRRTALYQCSFFPATSKLWNGLPEAIKSSDSLYRF